MSYCPDCGCELTNPPKLQGPPPGFKVIHSHIPEREYGFDFDKAQRNGFIPGERYPGMSFNVALTPEEFEQKEEADRNRPPAPQIRPVAPTVGPTPFVDFTAPPPFIPTHTQK